MTAQLRPFSDNVDRQFVLLRPFMQDCSQLQDLETLSENILFLTRQMLTIKEFIQIQGLPLTFGYCQKKFMD